ncbi:MAG TPA: HAD family phosphatase [Pirellulaceae bacterium]|jgi:FMN phosphatase YigB (HAD superfamily)
MRPEFIYFDMGNVLIHFSHEKMAEQMAQVVGIEPQLAWRILFEDKRGLEWAYERGELQREQFYARFCEAAGASADSDVLDTAGSDIFAINAPTCGLASQLASAGYRLGICSNTTLSHWGHCVSHYRVLATAFTVYALSFELGAIKPDPVFYRAAAKLTGASPDRIFFADDRPENVAAAKSAGWDAVVYESAAQINEALRVRGVISNC